MQFLLGSITGDCLAPAPPPHLCCDASNTRGPHVRRTPPRPSTSRACKKPSQSTQQNFQEEAGGGGDDADIDVDDASDAWAAASWARTAIAIKRVRATLQFEDEGQDAHSRMAKELSALAEVGFARMVRPHLPQPVVEDLYEP